MVADIAEIHAKKAKLLHERSLIDTQLAALEQMQAQKMVQIAETDTEVTTGRKRRAPVVPDTGAVQPGDQVAAAAARAVLRVMR